MKSMVKLFTSSTCLCMLRRQSTASNRQIPRTKSSVNFQSLLRDGGILLLSIPITTFGLGVWQVRRREWKLMMIKQLEEKTKSKPVPLPDSLEEIEALEYHNVRVRGTFDHTRELRIGPRRNICLLDKNNKQGGGIISSSSSTGYHVVTPFKLADRDLTILVNRGWIPRERRPTNIPKIQDKKSEEVELVGVVRLTEQRKQFMAKNNPEANSWVYRDVETMAQVANVAPIFIDADYASTVDGGPIGGQTLVTLRNEHGQYIITW